MTGGPIEDRSAFASFYRAEFSSTVRSVTSIVGLDAEDVTQEAFIAAYGRWGHVSQLDAPGAWVRLVAKRMAWRRSRRELDRPQRESARGEPGRSGPEFDLDLARAVGALPMRMRAAIELHHLADCSVREVAATLGCGDSAAKLLLHRARQSLAEILGSHRGRWFTERTWTVDEIAAQLEAHDDSRYVDVVVNNVVNDERWVFRLEGGFYLVESESGQRMDHGRYALRGRTLQLLPWNESGTVTLTVEIDGDLAGFTVVDDTTAPTRRVPDEVYLHLLLGSDTFQWAGHSEIPRPQM